MTTGIRLRMQNEMAEVLSEMGMITRSVAHTVSHLL